MLRVPARAQRLEHFPARCRAAPRVAMAAESTAAFKERVVQLGLEEFWGAFTRRSWTTYGTFAYSSSCAPESQDDFKFLADVVKELLGSETHAKTAVVRRLCFEICIGATAELWRRHERAEDEAPRVASQLSS